MLTMQLNNHYFLIQTLYTKKTEVYFKVSLITINSTNSHEYGSSDSLRILKRENSLNNLSREKCSQNALKAEELEGRAQI